MITLENRFFPVRSAVCFFVEGGIILVSVLASFFLLHPRTPMTHLAKRRKMIEDWVVIRLVILQREVMSLLPTLLLEQTASFRPNLAQSTASSSLPG